MKNSFLVLFLLLLTINCSTLTFEENCEDVDKNPTETKDCTSVNSDSEPDKYCCLVEAKSGSTEGKFCDAITKAEYDKIKDYVKSEKERYKTEDNIEFSEFKIHCQSAFLKIGLVSLIIGLLF